MPSAKPVFISHAAEDRPFAGHLATFLSARGADVFLAPEAALGSAWAETLRREVERASALILLLPSNSAADRNFVWFEAGAAKALGKRVLAVLPPHHHLREIPNDLADVLILDADRTSLDSVADTLMQAVPEIVAA